MNCPRCAQGELVEKARDGVMIDVCRTCRGVWLDRGELEKLIALATNEFDEDTPTRDHDLRLRDRDGDGGVPPDADRARRYRRHDSDDGHGGYIGDDDRPPAGMRPRRKKRWFDMFGDIFD